MNKRFAIVPCVIVGLVVVGRAPGTRDVLSWLLNKLAATYGYKPETLRSRFADDEMVEIKPALHHTHGVSAASRSTGSLFIEQYAKGLARRVWFFQCSRSDQRSHRLGSRNYFWAKDLTAAPAVFSPDGGDLLAMVDVDQYVDIPKFCVNHFRPLLLYTFQPGHVARSAGDYSYTFDSDNKVVYRVNGGAEYNHLVWNYSNDSLVLSKTFFGIPYQTVTYLVDKRGVDEDHQLILLTPLCKWRGLMAILARFLSGPTLGRFLPVQGDFLRMEKHTRDGVSMCTGRVLEYASSEIPSSMDSYFSSIARTSKVGLTLPQVKSRVTDLDGAAVLYEYHLSKLERTWPIVYPVDRYVRNYQFKPNEYDPDAKKSLKAFMEPLLDGAFCPDLCKANDEQAISGRITKVRNTTQLDRFLIRCVDEFVSLFLGEFEGTLVPVEPEDVYEKQNRPSQRRILKEAEFMEPKRVNKCFAKREAYQKISDPRIISQINGPDKYSYSMFLYGLADVLKLQDWYAFGKNPFEIAVRVVEITHTAASAGNTDFSRMDGHVSEVLRYLEKQVVLRAFTGRYSEQIIDLLRAQHSMRCYMAHGKSEAVVFDQGLARASGSPETSSFNTIDNAFIAYLTFRMTRQGGAFMSPTQAYKKLGLYGGDDGITADVDPATYVKAARRCGQVMEIEMIPRGNIGVKFLSRCYGPEVWYGDLTSTCDIKRAIAKFHVTVNMPPHITPEMKLLDKAFSYWLSDEHTPIIGDFVSKVVQYLPPNYKFENICGKWGARYTKEVQYPNEPRDWYLTVVEQQMPDFDYKKLIEWLSTQTSITPLLSPPQCIARIEPEMKTEVVVDDDIASPDRPGREQLPKLVRPRARRARPRTVKRKKT